MVYVESLIFVCQSLVWHRLLGGAQQMSPILIALVWTEPQPGLRSLLPRSPTGISAVIFVTYSRTRYHGSR